MAITKVTNSLVATNAIQGTLIADNAITSVHIAQNQVTSVQIPDGSITATQLGANSVDSSELVDGSIDTSHIADAQITTAKLGTNQVTSAKIAQNSIEARHIADGSITDTQLGSGAFTMGTITTTGAIRGPASLTIDPATVGDNTGTVVIAGNLQVDGTTTTINSTQLSVADKKITVGKGSGSSSAANESGFEVGVGSDGASSNPSMLYSHSGTKFVINKSLDVTGNIIGSGNFHAGDGTNISMDASANGQLEVDGNGYQGAIALDGTAMHVYHNSSSRSLILGTNETARLSIGGTGTFTFHSNNLQSIGTISSDAITSSGLFNLGGTGSLGSITTNQKILANFDGGYSTNNSAQNKVVGFIGTTKSTLNIFDSSYGSNGELQKNFYLGLSTGNSYFNAAKFVIVQGGVERFNMAQGGNATFAGNVNSAGLTVTGNVGIGTNSPTQKLDVNGTIAVGYNSNGTHQILKTYATAHASGNRGGQLQFGLNDGAFTGIKIINSAAANSSYNKQEITFETHEGAVAVAERMRIDSLGKVGIGTAAPTHKLQVLSTDNKGFYLERNTGNEPANLNEFSAYYSLSIKNRAGGSFLNFGGSSLFSSMQGTDGAGSAAAKHISLNPYGGNVGIGTTTPGDTLEVFTSAANKGITIKSGTGSSFENPTLTFIDVGNSSSTLAIKSDNFCFSTYNVTNALTITGSNGALTATPAAGGHVLFNNAGNNVDFRIKTNGNNDTFFVDGGADVVKIGHSAGIQSIARLGVRRNGAAIEFGHQNNSAGYFGTLGSFGSNGQPYIGFSTACDSAANTFTTYGHAGSIINGDLSGNLRFATVTDTSASGQTPVQRMIVKANGNVGIGVTSPNNKLEVDGHIGFSKGTNANRYLLVEGGDGSWAGTVNIQGGFGSTAAGGAIKLYGHSHGTYPGSVWIGGSANAAGSILFGKGGTGPGTIQMELNSGGGLVLHGPSANWNETTQGGTPGCIHLDPNTASDHHGNAITWGASDTSNGANAHAGIYVRSDGSYGTKMYISTTDSYGSGSKTSIKVDQAGRVTMPRQPDFLARRSSAGGSYNPYTYSHSVPYNDEIHDHGGNFDTSTGLFTAPVAGTYLFQGSIYSTSSASGGWTQAWLTVNGARENYSDIAGNGMNHASIISTTHMITLATGDTVGYHPYSANATYAFHSNVHHTWFKGRLLG